MAFGYVEKEIERRLNELVERGEMGQEHMLRLQKEIVANLKSDTPKNGNSGANEVSAEEIRRLTDKVEELTTRLDELVASSRTAERSA